MEELEKLRLEKLGHEISELVIFVSDVLCFCHRLAAVYRMNQNAAKVNIVTLVKASLICNGITLKERPHKQSVGLGRDSALPSDSTA